MRGSDDLKEYPILFSTEMVKAIQDDRKTMTRRVLQPQPSYFYNCIMGAPKPIKNLWGAVFGEIEKKIKCPYGQPGDLLWVRETWQEVFETEYINGETMNIRELITNFDEIDKVKAGLSGSWSPTSAPPREKYYVFKASDINYADKENALRWKPSIHMPKTAARIWLEVVSVRVERLQEITEEDAIKEGCMGTRCNHDGLIPGIGCTDCMGSGWLEPPQLDFVYLWNAINSNRGYGWDANPWCWVVEFKWIEPGVIEA